MSGAPTPLEADRVALINTAGELRPQVDARIPAALLLALTYQDMRKLKRGRSYVAPYRDRAAELVEERRRLLEIVGSSGASNTFEPRETP